MEATGNIDPIAVLLTLLVGRAVVSNPSKTRVIAEAKVKTDKVDSRILAQLSAADFLPPLPRNSKSVSWGWDPRRGPGRVYTACRRCSRRSAFDGLTESGHIRSVRHYLAIPTITSSGDRGTFLHNSYPSEWASRSRRPLRARLSYRQLRPGDSVQLPNFGMGWTWQYRRGLGRSAQWSES